MPAPQSIGESERAAVAASRGKVAAGIKDPQERKRFIARQGEDEAKERMGKGSAVGLEKIAAESSLEEGRQVAGGQSDDTTRTLRSYKKGGKVEKTGPALLHKGERVVPASEADGEKGAVEEMKIRKVHGGYHVRHTHKPTKKSEGGMVAPSESEHVLPDTSSLQDHIAEHFGGGEEALTSEQ